RAQDANTIQLNTFEENSFTNVSSQSKPLTEMNKQLFINHDSSANSLSQYFQNLLETKIQTSSECNLLDLAHSQDNQAFYNNKASLQFESLFKDSELELGSIYVFQNFNSSLQRLQESEI
ncbi:35827_t:CDS:2, partial [Racocetra persica]